MTVPVMSWASIGRAGGRTKRQAAAAAALLRANLVRLAAPVKVNLCVTYRCNYRCRTCNIWRRRPTGELTTAELLAFVAANDGIRWLDVTGGEIFLRQDIGDVLAAIGSTWKRLALLHFPTNGYLTQRIVEITSRLAATTTAQIIVTVSVDGDEVLNDAIRGIPGGYRRQIATFNALRGIPGVRPVIGMTLSPGNIGQFERTYDACRRDCVGLEAEDFHVNVAQRSEHYYGNDQSDDLSMPAADVLAEIARYRQLRRHAISPSAWVENRYLDHLTRYLKDGRTPMRCHALRSSCFVDPWGTVFPCITYTRPLGTLRDTGMRLAPLWAADDARDLQSRIWEGDCPQCWTPCEAYQSILGNLVRPSDAPPSRRLPLAPVPR